MSSFARLTLSTEVEPVLAGLIGDPKMIEHLRAQGLKAGLIGRDFSGLETLTDGRDFVAVVHRSGERTALWDWGVPELRRRGAKVVISANVFGFADLGPTASELDLVVCNSKHTLWRHWTASGRPDIESYLDGHRVIYNPVVDEPPINETQRLRLDLRSKLGIPSEAIVFCDVCRPAPEKLDWMAAEVMPRASLDRLDLYFITRAYPEPVARYLKSKMGDRYHNLALDHDRAGVVSTMAASDAMLHLSSMGESFGMAVGEAMRCSLPVVVNATPGPKQDNAQTELVIDGVTGLIIYRPHEAVEAVLRIAGDATLRRSMGAAGRDRFRDGALNPTVIAREFNEEILARYAGTPPPIQREPSRTECADYLRTYDPDRFKAGRGGRRMPFWSAGVELRRLHWRLVRRRSGR